MSRPPASPGPPPELDARVAVVGAESPDGVHVRQALARLGVPGSRVDLYGVTRGQAVLTEYAGEARLIQDPEVTVVATHGVVLLCEPSAATAPVLAERAGAGLVIDVAGCAPPATAAPVVHPDLNLPSPHALPRSVSVPHGIAAVLAEVLHALDSGPGVSRASAVVLRPASDFGERGVEELREQTVRLFSFREIPRETFGGQLCFNVVPDRARQREEFPLDERIVREVTAMLGWNDPRLAVRLLDVPVFHGHAAFLSVELDGRPGVGDVAEALDASSAFERIKDGRSATPMEVAAVRRTVIGEVSDDGAGGHWIWVVAGEVGAIPAELAVRLARAEGKL